MTKILVRKFLVCLATLPLVPLLTISAKAEGVVLAPLAHGWPGVNPGELLLGELNCTGCHQASDSVRSQITPRQAPRLGRGGLTLTPQYLRSLLTDPQSQKHGGTMPDVLQHLSGEEKAEAVDDLVHFLISFQAGRQTDEVAANEFLLNQGRLLYHQVGCVACHAPEESAVKVSHHLGNEESSGSLETPELQATSIPLGELARKTTVGDLSRFLVNPLNVRPSGRCPSLNLTKTEATAVAMYLLRDQAGLKDPNRPPAKVAGLQYEYYEGEFSQAAQMENAKVVENGMIPKFDMSPVKRSQYVGLRFTGYVRVPQSGEYTFYASSDDGTLLYLDGRLLVDNDGHHGGTERSGRIQLEAGDHPIMLLWFNYGGPAELRVSYAGPGLPKQEIPATALTHLGQPMEPLDREEFSLDPTKARRGKDRFADLGCASCHELSGQRMSSSHAAPALAELSGKGDGGCLSLDPPAGAPRYALSENQRRALGATLAHLNRLNNPLTAEDRVQRGMATFSCYACHRRDGVGGPEPERAKYFTTTFEVDLGDEGRLPPHLSGVGGKLKPEWFKQVLLNNGRARPYMATRMPQFGAENVGQLPAIFAKADYLGSPEMERFERSDAKWGRKLVGTTGLSCIACHTFAGHASLGVPAMDLTYMPDRLQPDWFKRYLRDPASLRPGTRMPSFWPDGQAANTEILGGEVDRQIEAIWGYLSLAKDTGLPPGLIQGQMELVVTNEAVLYRHWISGSGPRTIAVGYPERANLAFDADSLRLAVIWQGPFIDAAKHRSGRGNGFEGPLGYNVVQLSEGPPLALLDAPETAWPSQTGTPAGYRFLGYRLDQIRRPVFLYRFGNVHVEDHFEDLPGELDGTFRRTLTMTSEQPPGTLWFRAWTGSDLTPKGDNRFLADGKVMLRLDAGNNAVIRRNRDRVELLVPIRFEEHQATLIEEISW